MANASRAEFCRVVTGDGLTLDGCLRSPETSSADLGISAMLLVHGTGSSFYAGGVLERYAEQALAAGLAVLRVNTRGHDLVARIAGAGKSVWGGAAYERISDCRCDLAAWVSFLSEQGHTRIALVGHSMGAVKAIYAMAHDRHEAVRFVMALSPPRFCHQKLMSHPLGGPFREDYQKAQRMVAEGRGQDLFSARQPLALLITAEGFLAKYGPRDDYDYFQCLPKLSCPCLILTGSESVRISSAFADVPEDLAKLMAEHPQLPLRFELVEGADTGYSTCLREPFHRAERWLQSLAQ